MISLFGILSFMYTGGMFLLLKAWLKIDAAVETPSGPGISVIVPVRNEVNRLAPLLNDLSKQDHGRFEILIVDDHSTDGTAELVRVYLKRGGVAARLIQLNPEENGKKSALVAGIREASYPVILTTDADCRVGSSWVSSMSGPFLNADIKMVTGPVQLTGKTSFDHWQSLEFAGLLAMGAATLHLGKPTMCNGANLAYRKSAFHEVGGFGPFSNQPSGDDEFLMHQMYSNDPQGVIFNKSTAAIVKSEAAPTFYEFNQQRLRWASKWGKYNNPASHWIALFVVVYYLALLATTIMTLTGHFPLVFWATLLGIKLIADVLFLQSALSFFDKVLNPFLFLILEFVYPFYVLFYGISGRSGSFEWKGRKYSRHDRAGIHRT